VKKLLAVTLFSGLLTLLRMVSGFLVSKVVAIYAGPSGIAMLGQVQSVVAAMNGIVAAPVGNGIVRYTAENHEGGFDECAPWWRASLRWMLGIIVIIIPIAFVYSRKLASWTLGDANYSWLIIIAAISLPLAGANTLVASVINGQQLYRRFIGLGMVSVIGATALTVLLIHQYGRDGALLSAALSAAIAGTVMIIGVLREPWFRIRYWMGRVEKEKLRMIGGYVAMAVCSATCASLGVILVRNVIVANVGWEKTGYWQAVFKISEVYLGVVTMALSTYYLPRLSRLQGKDIRGEILSTAKVVMPMVTILALCIYLLRDFVIGLLFTQQFSPAKDLFAIQLVGDVIKMASWICAYPMLSRGSTTLFVSTEIIFSGTFVALAWVMVRFFGVQGATIAFTLNYAVYLVVVIFYLPRSTSVSSASHTTVH
jgi:O-antigen/teichoic acid export membrane protein